MKVKIKKSVAFLMLLLTVFSVFTNILPNIVNATEIQTADLKNGGDCGYHLQFWDSNANTWSYIITTFVFYEENGVQYPAYCLDKGVPGVGQNGTPEYTVDITKLIDDVRIWRVAVNGYPYQSPESLGVANKFDAFVATKQAIYSIIYGTDVESYYKGGDSRGVAIKNAVARLVDIGRNGSQTPANTNITVEKVNNFYEDGNYYSQEYRINAPVETSQYTITATAGLPDGSRITDLSGNDKTTFSGNENFKVQIPKDKLSSDINAVINVKGKSKTYPVFYGATRIPGTQDYLLTYDPFGDTTGRTDLSIKTNTGKLQIIKTDDETFEPIANVTFGLYTTDGTEVARATTNSAGIVEFKNLYQKSYVVKELSTSENYIMKGKNTK